MIVCQSCGKNYDEQFKFCPHCGQPKSMSSNPKINTEDIWETCEIDFVNKEISFWKSEFMFEATAIGIKGRYSAGLSDPVKGGGLFAPALDYKDSVYSPNRENSRPMLDGLIAKLVADEWQPVGRGQEWYSEKFRRKVKK